MSARVESLDTIDVLRREIERIDGELVALVAARVALARDVGRAKREAGLPTVDPAREAAVLRRAAELARDTQLDEEGLRSLFWSVIALSRRAQAAER